MLLPHKTACYAYRELKCCIRFEIYAHIICDHHHYFACVYVLGELTDHNYSTGVGAASANDQRVEIPRQRPFGVGANDSYNPQHEQQCYGGERHSRGGVAATTDKRVDPRPPQRQNSGIQSQLGLGTQLQQRHPSSLGANAEEQHQRSHGARKYNLNPSCGHSTERPGCIEDPQQQYRRQGGTDDRVGTDRQNSMNASPATAAVAMKFSTSSEGKSKCLKINVLSEKSQLVYK